MLIVSQDKRLTTKSLELSIENIENIENKDAKKNMVESNCERLYYLGKYATEERAKEVLQEITTRYKNWGNMKVGQPTGICLPVYEMPQE